MKAISRIILLSILMLAPLVHKAQSGTNVLKVSGEAVIDVVPENMVVRIPIEVKDKEYKATSDKLVQTYNALVEALSDAGLDRDTIKSSSLQISEDYQYIERERKLVGYVGRIQVTIEMNHDTEMLQGIMSTLADERFKFGYQLGFQLSDMQQDSLTAEAIRKATTDAKRKAELLASALGVRMIEVVEIDYEFDQSGGGIPVYRDHMMMKEAADQSSGDLELNPRQIEMRKKVRVIWSIAK